MSFHRFLLSFFPLLALTAAPSAGASGAKKLTVGVFLPTAIAEGQARFEFGEAFAKRLSDELGAQVISKNFGRWEDFLSAANRGQLDFAVIDGWVGAQSFRGLESRGLAIRADGSTHERWAVVARGPTLVKNLAGKKLAVPKASAGLDVQLVSNLLFEGDFSARNFKLTTAPNVESVLQVLQANGAQAAVIPASQVPDDLSVIYRSDRFPHVLLLTAKSLEPSALKAALGLGQVGPFKGFKSADGSELEAFSRLASKGPPKRQCVLAEAPVLPLDTNRFLKLGEVGFVMPSFTEFVALSEELPDP